MNNQLKGWNYIVLKLIENHFKNIEFTLNEIYSFVPYFKTAYPKNNHIEDKIRQTLQNLRNKGMISFEGSGKYRLLKSKELEISSVIRNEFVYLISNEAMPNWVKIGKTYSLDQRLKELYNTSVPLPFKLVEYIKTKDSEEARTLEYCLHQIIDTINPNLRKNTDANRREFFNMSLNEGINVFKLVSKIMMLNPQ
jgi:hypothetical protein